MADKRDVRSALRAYEQPSMLQGAWDEISGAFARYGRRSGAQRDASLAMLNQAVDPNTDPLTGAGMKALGLAGLVTHPLAFFPTGDEWRERTRNAGNTGRMGQAIGGMLGDLPSIADPHLLAGGGALAMAPLAAKMMNKADDAADAGIVAYHGSPHSFDKFDASKIGTGEGNQAYMRGLYFAEKEDVATTYRDQITKQAAGSDPALERAARYLNQNNGDYEAAYAELLPQRNSAAKSLDAQKAKGKDTSYLERDVANYDAALTALQSKAPVNGSMYQVRINARPEEFMDWDIPLSQQPKKVADALRGLDPKLFETETWASQLDGAKTKGRTVSYGPDNRTGETAARAFEENLGGAEIAAEKLKAAGIKGVRYLDNGSRNAGGWHITPPDQTVSGKWMVKSSDYNSKGLHFDTEDEAKAALSGKVAGQTYNYVVFDDKLITILKKYGIPMTAGAGGAMMVAGQDMPPDIASQMGGT